MDLPYLSIHHSTPTVEIRRSRNLVLFVRLFACRSASAQRGQNDVPLYLSAGDGSPFVKLIPKIAEGLRANGCTHVETC